MIAILRILMMSILLYFLEMGVMRGWAHAYFGKRYTLLEGSLAVLFFGCTIFYAKYARVC
jgi:uncharacterized membrane protein